MNTDPMKKAIVDTLVKENGIEFCELDNTCYLIIGKISYWITAKGNIRYINPEHEQVMDFSDFKPSGDHLDTAIYLIKKYKQTIKEI